MTDTNSEELEDQRIKSVRDKRSSRLSKPPFRKFRKLYRFAEEWFENVPDARRELKGMIAEIENEEFSELAQAQAKGESIGREKERNAILKDIIEKGGFIGVREGKEYSFDVVCRSVLDSDENDK